jgi:hypothetical protein
MSVSDLSKMTRAQLKTMAKGRGIFQYYILPKDDLVALLSMPEVPKAHKLKKMTIVQMRALATERGLSGFWGLHKKDLCRALFPEHDDTVQYGPSHKKKQDDGKTTEHQYPKNQDAENVGIQVVENA